jgi:hypothetical protein
MRQGKPFQPSAERGRLTELAGDVEKLKEVCFCARSTPAELFKALEDYLCDPSFTAEKLKFLPPFPRVPEDFDLFLRIIHTAFPKRACNANVQWQDLEALKRAPHCRKFGNYHVFFASHDRTPTDWPGTCTRLIHTETYVSLAARDLQPLMDGQTLADQNSAGQGTTANVLPIIAGESGSGKTHLLLTCDVNAITVYVLSLPAELKQANVVDEAGKSPEECWIRKMANFVIAEVLLHLRAPKKWGLRLIIAFDEMGQQGAALRLLCRYRGQVCTLVADACHAESVRMIAAGTGAERFSRPGSLPNSYRVVILKPDPFVWKVFVDRHPELLPTLNINFNVLRGLVGNPRAAVILVGRIHSLIKGHDAVVQATILRSSIDLLLALVASTYKAKSGMSEFLVQETVDHCADAFRAVHCRSAVINEHRLTQLVARCGLITDHRVIQGFDEAEELAAPFHAAKEKNKAEGSLNDVAMVGEKSFHVTPTKGRFTMSAAIGLMILNQFGVLQTNFDTAGEALKELLAAKIALTFALTNTLQEAFEALDIRNPQRISETVLGGRNVVKLPWFTATAQEIEQVAQELKSARAVVITNCEGGPHADVIVAVRGWLGFFQTMDVQAKTNPFADELNTTHMWQDPDWQTAHTVTNELQIITETHRRNPDIVLVVHNDQSSQASPRKVTPVGFTCPDYVHVLDTNSDVLKPFLWPQQAPPQRRTVLPAINSRDLVSSSPPSIPERTGPPSG